MVMRYTFSDMDNLSAAIAKAHRAVDTVKTDIHSSAGTLQQNWTGSAGESWSTVQAKWDKACDALVTALNHLATTVHDNGSAMKDAEKRNGNLFHGM